MTDHIVPSGFPERPLLPGGRGHSGPVGLFEREWVISASDYPARGTIDPIPLEEHVRLSPRFSPAAAVVAPPNEAIAERCGHYLVLTESPEAVLASLPDRLQRWNHELAAPEGG